MSAPVDLASKGNVMAHRICAKCSSAITSEHTPCPECGSSDTMVFAVDQANGGERDERRDGAGEEALCN